MMSTTIQPMYLVPQAILDDMIEILDYLWDDEKQDYLSRDEQDREGHIFAVLQSVRGWWDSTV